MAIQLVKSTIIVGGSGGGGSTPDASSTTKGKVKLANALSGTADLPQVFEMNSREELIALINELIEAGGGTIDPVTYMDPGYVARGYVQ